MIDYGLTFCAGSILTKIVHIKILQFAIYQIKTFTQNLIMPGSLMNNSTLHGIDNQLHKFVPKVDTQR
jgi:hypothetical protein